MRDSFIFYRSFYLALSRLDDATFRRVVDMVCEYAFDGTEPDSSMVVEGVIFELIKPQIDANNKRYDDGRKGGRPRKTTSENLKTSGFEVNNQWLSDEKPVVSGSETSGFEVGNQWLRGRKPNVNVNGNDNGDGNEDGNGNADVSHTTTLPTATTSHIPPSIQEVRMYILDNSLDVIAEKFMAYYEDRNWTTAKGQPMKDWRAAVRYWDKTEHKNSKRTQFAETRTDSLDGFVRAINGG